MKVFELLDSISYLSFIGEKNTEVEKIVPLGKQFSSPGALMWVSEKNIAQISQITQGTVIAPEFDAKDICEGCNYIIVKNPRDTFRFILQRWFAPHREEGISRSAVIDASATLGQRLYIGENVVIEKGCTIGDGCSIGHNTVLKSGTTLGNNVVIGCNCTIGGVGFGYEKNEAGAYEMIPHIGAVRIADNVDIGNNTCIDRGVLSDTFIGNNVKVDNLVHIAHGVTIDNNSLIIANAMIAGSVDIGKNVWVAPSASVLNKLTIEDNAVIGMAAVVVKNVPAGDVIVGNPGKSIKK